MKKIAALLSIFVLVLCMALPAYAAESKQRVYDLAGLYSASDKATLESDLSALVDEIGMDVAVLTTDRKNGKSLRDYSEDFYVEKDFGVGADDSGLVILIDMEDRTVYIATRGNAINYYNDARIIALTDENDTLYDCLAAGQYLAGTESVIEGIREYYKKGIEQGQHTYNEDTGEIVYYKKNHLSILEIILAVLIPGVIGLIYTGNIKKKYAMKAEKNNSAGYLLAYRAISAFAFATATDKLLNESVTTRMIPVATAGGGNGKGGSTQGQSTIHNSSHGGTFGGGGGGRHF